MSLRQSGKPKDSESIDQELLNSVHFTPYLANDNRNRDRIRTDWFEVPGHSRD